MMKLGRAGHIPGSRFAALFEVPQALRNPESPGPQPPRSSRSRAYLGFRVLQICFIGLPIIVGVDKFFHLLTNWDQYLSPAARAVLGSHSHLFMKAVGVLEITVGIGMFFKPSIFSYVISAWLLGIVVNLLLTGAFFDVALRDFALMLATFALGAMSDSFGKRP